MCDDEEEESPLISFPRSKLETPGDIIYLTVDREVRPEYYDYVWFPVLYFSSGARP
jgi:hypothetical protein